MSGNSLWYVTTLPNVMSLGIVVVEIGCFQLIVRSSKATWLKSQTSSISIDDPEGNSSPCQF